MEEMIKAIGDNGLMIVFSGVFLYLIVQVANIGINLLKRKTEEEKHDKLNNMRLEVSYQIQLLIDKIRLECEADRITVMEFKNGASNIAGLPFLLMSCTYESMGDNLLPIMDLLRDKMLSQYPMFLTKLQTNDYVILDLESRSDEFGKAIYELLVLQDECSGLCMMMKSNKKIGIGYITMKKKGGGFTEEDIDKMKTLSVAIGSLLLVGSNNVRG
jgi:hypothetical protein